MKTKNWYYRFFTIVFIALFAIVAVFWISNQRFEHSVIKTEAETIASEKKAFENNPDVATALRTGKIDQSTQSFLTTFASTSQQIVTIVDAQFKPLFQSNRTVKVTRDEQTLTAIKKGAEYGYQTELINGKRFLSVTFPYKEKNKILAYIQLSLPYTAFNQAINHFSTYSALLFIGLFIIVMLLFYFLYRQHTQPIRTVLPTLKRIAKQPQKEVLILENTPEWNELYQTVNTVAKQMNRTYRAYEDNKRQFESLIHDLQVGIFLIDEQQQLRLINPSGQQFLHLKNFQPGMHYVEALKQIDLVKLIQQCLHEQKDVHGEIHVTQPHEAIFDIKLRYLSENQRIIGTIYNITELRKLETMQEDFVGNVSHELKTPITSIIGFTETLLDGAKDDPEMSEQFLHIIEKDAQRLQQLIQEIIQLSRSASELDKDDIVAVSPIEVINGLLQHYQKNIDDKQLTIQVTGKSSLTIQTFLYYFDPIIKNLIENAISYNRQKGSVTIAVTETNHHCQITIADTGIGMAEKDLERVFERFYRVDKARSRNLGGTGLGLAIVKHYTEVLHGTVTVKSQLGVGTTFTLIFPKTLIL